MARPANGGFERARSCARTLALAALLALGAACGGEPGTAPVHHDLMLGFEPVFPRDAVVLEDASDHTLTLLRGDDGRPVLEMLHRPTAWVRDAIPGTWITKRRIADGLTRTRERSGYTVEIDGRAATAWSGTKGAAFDIGTIAPNTYANLDELLAVYTGPEGVAAPTVVERVRLPIGGPNGAGWNVDAYPWFGAGVLVPAGVPQELSVPPPEPDERGTRRLSLAAFAQGLPDAPPVLVVAFDGEEAERFEFDPARASRTGQLEFLTFELPGDVERIGLRFEGAPGVTGVLAPVVTTAEPRGTRTLDDRPNIVVFVADTLRADALESQRVFAGSPHGVTFPNLARLERDSVLFDRAWASSSWTLPTHSSMFTGLHPGQHTATGLRYTLPDEALTLAELLRADGYRTVALTDGTYLSVEYGLEQGFDVFDEGYEDAQDALVNATRALEHHDGRPTFLFVHTYFVHGPYEPSERARAAHGIAADVRWSDFESSMEELEEWDVSRGPLVEDPRTRDLRSLYWAEVQDFDEHFGRFMTAFDANGWNETSVLFFLADHGEAFGERDAMFHGGVLDEAIVRIPFLVHGARWPKSSARRRADIASHVDLAPTIAELTGSAAPEQWIGRSLLHEAEASAWFQIDAEEDEHESGLVYGRHKLVRDDLRSSWRAFDIDDDREERSELAPPPRELLAEFERRAAVNKAPVLTRVPMQELSASLRAHLEALGYLERR